MKPLRNISSCKIVGCKALGARQIYLVKGSLVTRRFFHKSYCWKHYLQIRRHGHILSRTKYDKNEIFDKGDYFEAALYTRKNKIRGYFKFDKEDLKFVQKYKWSIIISSGNKYIGTYIKGKYSLLHRLIMKCPKNMQVDHKFGDTLDNRKSQLRICTNQQNGFNKAKQKNTKCKYKGVHKYGDQRKWRVIITINGRTLHLGCFQSEIEAAQVWNKAAKKYQGEFARLNII